MFPRVHRLNCGRQHPHTASALDREALQVLARVSYTLQREILGSVSMGGKRLISKSCEQLEARYQKEA